MYEGISLKGLSSDSFNDLVVDETEVTEYKNKKAISFKSLEEFYLDNADYDESNTTNTSEVFSADLIINSLFPSVKNAEVFISHSHADKDLAIKLAFYLNRKFNLNVFIDSCVWAHSSDLLLAVVRKHCPSKKDEKTFDYEQSMKAAAHVNMMLNAALHKMIDTAELFLFIDTDNSVGLRNVINNEEKTFSPWIFSELFVSSIIQRNPPKWLSNLQATLESIEKSKNKGIASHEDATKVKFAHGLYKEHLLELSSEDFFKNAEHIIKSNNYCSNERDALILEALEGSFHFKKQRNKECFLKWIFDLAEYYRASMNDN
ncbi:hypothetical protein LX59_03017 [Azomonas agilis]|uniref:TIR domain-containing protein n=1 Tax=Azomonas agilis TaxID=116849 RepID=A0A562HZN4_9GAMM|nr:toll/interleukin-1 receptor domain-containing protein [Azomonas agilis]TWH63853.1 hypothetical protein LX59_03017 [Azomonas agilis]